MGAKEPHIESSGAIVGRNFAEPQPDVVLIQDLRTRYGVLVRVIGVWISREAVVMEELRIGASLAEIHSTTVPFLEATCSLLQRQ